MVHGDFNKHGIVDIAEVSTIANNWNLSGKQNGISTLDMAHGDVNQDGIVDIGDMVVIANNWNQTSSFNLAAAEVADGLIVPALPLTVPEPATLGMWLAVGAA